MIGKAFNISKCKILINRSKDQQNLSKLFKLPIDTYCSYVTGFANRKPTNYNSKLL